jgi:hypothetical protein
VKYPIQLKVNINQSMALSLQRVCRRLGYPKVLVLELQSRNSLLSKIVNIGADAPAITSTTSPGSSRNTSRRSWQRRFGGT